MIREPHLNVVKSVAGRVVRQPYLDASVQIRNQ